MKLHHLVGYARKLFSHLPMIISCDIFVMRLAITFFAFSLFFFSLYTNNGAGDVTMNLIDGYLFI